MEQKKAYHADLERHRLTWFLIGLIVSLSALFVALQYNATDNADSIDNDLIDDLAQETELLAAPDRQDMVAAVEPQPKKSDTQKIKIVEQKTQLEKAADITQMRIVGDDGNAGSGTTDEASDNNNALKPVAVDNADNPLNFRIVEQLPEFPGGMSAFVKWLTDNLRYPPMAQQQKIQGRVVVSFIINRDGTISNIKVAKSVHPMLDREALRVARMMPNWAPGKENNKPCRTLFAIPIEFKI